MSQDAEVRQLREAFRQARDEAHLMRSSLVAEADALRAELQHVRQQAAQREAVRVEEREELVRAYEAMLGDVKSGIMSSYTRGFGLLGGEAPPAFTPVQDVPCQQMGNYAAALETQITSVHKHSKKYIERHRALAASMTGFGLSLTQLANCESEINASLAKALSQMGLCVDRLSNLYTEQAAKENAAFEEPMKDYIRVLAQAKQAIAALHRGEASKAAQSLHAGDNEWQTQAAPFAREIRSWPNLMLRWWERSSKSTGVTAFAVFFVCIFSAYNSTAVRSH